MILKRKNRSTGRRSAPLLPDPAQTKVTTQYEVARDRTWISELRVRRPTARAMAWASVLFVSVLIKGFGKSAYRCCYGSCTGRSKIKSAVTNKYIQK
jgi:hypothetical protein